MCKSFITNKVIGTTTNFFNVRSSGFTKYFVIVICHIFLDILHTENSKLNLVLQLLKYATAT